MGGCSLLRVRRGGQGRAWQRKTCTFERLNTPFIHRPLPRTPSPPCTAANWYRSTCNERNDEEKELATNTKLATRYARRGRRYPPTPPPTRSFSPSPPPLSLNHVKLERVPRLVRVVGQRKVVEGTREDNEVPGLAFHGHETSLEETL